MKKYIVLIIIILLVLVTINRFTYREDPNRQFITDKDGRILIFHGINVISAAKSDPLRVGGTTQEDFTRIADDWGFNAVRLLIFWDGIEPEPGQFFLEPVDVTFKFHLDDIDGFTVQRRRHLLL